jgi:hypothetical protein
MITVSTEYFTHISRMPVKGCWTTSHREQEKEDVPLKDGKISSYTIETRSDQ